MSRLLIFGNSASGKSTLAKQFAAKGALAHLDLDSLAWLPTTPPRRKPLEESRRLIERFMNRQEQWVIEGCYTDLLEMAASQATEIIFLNLEVAQCVENARNRPWEPHKYSSPEAQDENLEMLILWIEDYHERRDVFSYESHLGFFEAFEGRKRMIRTMVKEECGG